MRGSRRPPRKLGHAEIARHAVGEAPAYDERGGIRRRSRRSSIARCCRTARARSRVAGCASCGAPSMCSASISPASTCARTPTCMSASIDELFEKAVPGTGYASLPEEQRVALLLEELRTPRPSCLALSRLFGRDRIRTRHRPRGREGASPVRRGVGSELRHLEGERSVRHSRSRLAAEGGGAAASARRRDGRQHRSALRDHRGSAQLQRA